MDTEEMTEADTDIEFIAGEDRPAPKGPFARYWERVGGGSFTVSVMLHAGFVMLAVFFIFFTQNKPVERPPIEFLSGGGGGTDGNTQINKPKQRMMLNRAPAVKLASTAQSNISIPDTTSTMTTSSFAVVSGQMSGTPGSGGGFGGGDGTGIGRGKGPGMGPGNGAGFVAMFGKKIQARKLAVVLDISGSMHRFLPTVVKEANKVSGGCPIVLFYGCGLKETKDRKIERTNPEMTRGKEFKEFWQREFAPRGMAPDKDGPVPNEEVYKVFNDRKDTWFFPRINISYSWLALTSAKVRGADAIYWFCDFQDPVDEAQLLEIQKTLKNRKQKLYVHASGQGNPSLDAVTELLVKPTGGEVLKVEIDTRKTP